MGARENGVGGMKRVKGIVKNSSSRRLLMRCPWFPMLPSPDIPHPRSRRSQSALYWLRTECAGCRRRLLRVGELCGLEITGLVGLWVLADAPETHGSVGSCRPTLHVAITMRRSLGGSGRATSWLVRMPQGLGARSSSRAWMARPMRTTTAKPCARPRHQSSFCLLLPGERARRWRGVGVLPARC